ncbi:uncharacterized protein [Montipora foliosa]|uniref:uncharacterized protein n=1 Tax=Montipora foliosa TaxID=591990 RepID=UPI0035F184C6
MNIPAFTAPTLSIGSTFDLNRARKGQDIFPSDIPTKTENVNSFSFRYKVVAENDEVKELLGVPFDLPLRIKANKVSVEGPGKYFTDIKTEEGKTEVLILMKCITVSKRIDHSAKPSEILKRRNVVDGLGTHYVRRVLYGGQMVASIKLSFPPTLTRPNMKGTVQGELPSKDLAKALSQQLNIMSSECEGASSISICYYTTEMPYQPLPTCNLQELITLLQAFRVHTINEGKEIPIEVELQPTETLIPSVKTYQPNRALVKTLEEIENRFDDLRTADYLVKKYHKQNDGELEEDVKRFGQEVREVMKIYVDAISMLNVGGKESQFDDCFTAYESALDGYDEEGKFVQFWRNVLTKTKLPPGKDLSIVLIGQPGSGKSATAISIVGIAGKHIFKTTPWSTTTASSEFQFGCRIEERKIDVLDTPGVLKGELEKEVPKILSKYPNGFDAIVLVAKYGERLTAKDAKALQLLREFLGDKAKDHIILLLTYADQAEHETKEDRVTLSLDAYRELWLQTLPDWAQTFIEEIDERVIFFNNRLSPERNPDAYKTQLSQLIRAIDGIVKTTPPYLQTAESREDLTRKIKKATTKPTKSGRKSQQDGWEFLDVPGYDEPVTVAVGDTQHQDANTDGSLRERVFDFITTYCTIL